MTQNAEKQEQAAPRWRYVLLAALIFVMAAAVLAGLWQVYQAFPQLTQSPSTATPSATLLPPTPSPTSTITPTPTPAITEPIITSVEALVDDQAATLTFRLTAQVPPDRGVSQVLLWYDTETGHQLQRFNGPLQDSISLSHQLDPTQEGLTRTLTTTQELDYWWFVRDTSGHTARAGGTALLGPSLQALVVTPPPEPPPVDFTWAISDTQHYQFYYMPGSAAERDLAQLGELAERALSHISNVLDVQVDEQMSIYFVPRIFWQGGAAYGDKVQLISYPDRNYTSVETWSYFTHEGTHAVAQDLLQPKEEGGPDGVLVEGLAVWASSGHYRQEPIDAWAGLVVASDKYLPLPDLRAGPFYDFQHETSYLESASFVQFLVERYGLDKVKELYGRATGEAEHDNALVVLLYGRDYAGLEADWLANLQTQNPTAEEAETWQFKVRSFDLMRRYETELDPDARVLPAKAPPEWTSDTLKIFLGRTEAPVNIVLETALIAAQERMVEGDAAGASALLDDVEAALDAGGELVRPSLLARQSILEALADQDRAVLLADASAYRSTLHPDYAKLLGDTVENALRVPFVSYHREIVRLDLHDDGLGADVVVVVHAAVADGGFDGDGRLFALRLAKTTSGWQVVSQEPWATDLTLPLVSAD